MERCRPRPFGSLGGCERPESVQASVSWIGGRAAAAAESGSGSQRLFLRCGAPPRWLPALRELGRRRSLLCVYMLCGAASCCVVCVRREVVQLGGSERESSSRVHRGRHGFFETRVSLRLTPPFPIFFERRLRAGAFSTQKKFFAPSARKEKKTLYFT